MGGMVECYTQQGIRYFIQEQAKTKDYVSGETLLVQGDSPAEVRKRARKVIRKAEDDEFEKSLQIVKGNRYYIEYKAKQHVKYNAAFRWECTYGKDMPGKIPVYKHHPAYE